MNTPVEGSRLPIGRLARAAEVGVETIRFHEREGLPQTPMSVMVGGGRGAQAGVLLSPMIAAAAMSASSICVITNALRLRQIELERTAAR